MMAHDLHDALNLLPSDLLTAADKVRIAPKARHIPWKRLTAMAAVFALVFGTALVFGRTRYPYLKDAKMESAVSQEPAAAAPMAPLPGSQEVAADEALPELPSDVGAPEIPYEEAAGESKAENGLCIDHSHRVAEEEQTVEDPVTGYCGNMTAAIDVAGEHFEISGSDAVALTDILINLNYDPAQVCRCMTDITVDTETLTGIRINLGEAFARCEKGQAALTEDQVQVIRQIIEKLS